MPVLFNVIQREYLIIDGLELANRYGFKRHTTGPGFGNFPEASITLQTWMFAFHKANKQRIKPISFPSIAKMAETGQEDVIEPHMSILNKKVI